MSLPHSHKPLSPYRPTDAPPLDLTNSPRLQSLIRDGKLYISLSDTIALAIENNLDLAYFRYNFPIAETDIARTKAGGTGEWREYRNCAIVHAGRLQFGGQSGGAGASSGSAAAGAGGIVTSTLGAEPPSASFDPYLKFQGFVDHNVTQEANPFQYGVPTFQAEHHRGPGKLHADVSAGNQRDTSTMRASASQITARTKPSIPRSTRISRWYSHSICSPVSASPPTSATCISPKRISRLPTLPSAPR